MKQCSSTLHHKVIYVRSKLNFIIWLDLIIIGYIMLYLLYYVVSHSNTISYFPRFTVHPHPRRDVLLLLNIYIYSKSRAHHQREDWVRWRERGNRWPCECDPTNYPPSELLSMTLPRLSAPPNSEFAVLSNTTVNIDIYKTLADSRPSHLASSFQTR